MAGTTTTTLDERLQSISGRVSKDDIDAAQRAAAEMERHSGHEDMLQYNMFAEERKER